MITQDLTFEFFLNWNVFYLALFLNHPYNMSLILAALHLLLCAPSISQVNLSECLLLFLMRWENITGNNLKTFLHTATLSPWSHWCLHVASSARPSGFKWDLDQGTMIANAKASCYGFGDMFWISLLSEDPMTT